MGTVLKRRKNEVKMKESNIMRIITRPDFDGIVCAVLLFEAENVTGPVKWVDKGISLQTCRLMIVAHSGLTITIPTKSTNRLKAHSRLPLQQPVLFLIIIKTNLNAIIVN
jgi:hypothetical protein